MGVFSRLFGRIPAEPKALTDIDPSGVALVGWPGSAPVPDGGYVDLPVPRQSGTLTTAWSNGVRLHVPDPGVPLAEHHGGCFVNPELVWRTQPNVRKVIDFIARNVASIPLHVYERAGDNDRPRADSQHPLVKLLAEPQAATPPFRFWRGVIADGLLYDRWCVLKQPGHDRKLRLVRIPARSFRFNKDTLDRVTSIHADLGSGQWQDIPLDQVLFDHGYSPNGVGLTPMQTLSDILSESAEAIRYRRQVWANGARAHHWLEIPLEAEASGFDRARFEAEYKARFTGTGPDAGGSPMLGDGVKLHELRGFTAQDLQDIEGRRLTAIEVAAAFHIAPELVGAQQGNYSNVREFRQMLYRDSLGAYIIAWEEAVNLGLSDLTEDRRYYIEAAVEAKLRGSFEDQAQYLQSSVGRPWMTADEARGRLNMPALGGDAEQLVTPLNVIVGGQASPRDSGSQNVAPKALWRVKMSGQVAERLRDDYAGEIAKFVERQQAVILSALGAKSQATDAWDKQRWNRELAAITKRRMTLAARLRAAEVREAFDVDDWDDEIMDGWLDKAAQTTAERFNDRTLEEVDKASRASDWKTELLAVFAVAMVGRAIQLATSSTTEAGNFGAAEVAKTAGLVSKTWRVTSGNPRASHAALDGETVAMGETFSNGAKWPGDAVLDAEERANCTCEIEFGRAEQ